MVLSDIYMLDSSERTNTLKKKMLDEPRYVSIEQARLITQVYREHGDKPRAIVRALALGRALEELDITLDPQELIVGNRTKGVRAGVVFPESGSAWVDKEFDTFPTRPQDKFQTRPEDIREFREEILPFWDGKTLEDRIGEMAGPEIDQLSTVVKINQKDHAQGHICPDSEQWLRLGPTGLKAEAETYLQNAKADTQDFYKSVIIVLEGVSTFMERYAKLAEEMAEDDKYKKDQGQLLETARICRKIAVAPPETFREAVQSLWFLFAILQMESNASSFSPGRADQYLLAYYQKDVEAGILDQEAALEIIEGLWLKFNQIVYLRNSHSAKYFAGFPIGFNIAVGGQLSDGTDATNDLSYLMLQAQYNLGLPQPNLSVRLHKGSPDEFVRRSIEVVAKGSGMPQYFNDEAVIPALMNQEISEEDARNYAIVGCVELTTHGNNLGWSDAAMFNLVKVLELTMNNGVCLLTGRKLGLETGEFSSFAAYEDFEAAYDQQMKHFIDRMVEACEVVEQAHQELLPSPFLSSVINDCLAKGIDVTAGGAHYNLSGIQVIQGANIADSFAAIKKLVFDEKRIEATALIEAMRNDYAGEEVMRQTLLNHAPKYGNDVEWVDDIANKWVTAFNRYLSSFTNYRGGPYHTGLYTVSAHVPMGQNVGASADGRFSREPLADGGMSPVYGRDINGPTAVLKSVSRISHLNGSNGTLLNMKFLPSFFNPQGIEKFMLMLRTFVKLKIPHIQFNVLRQEDLIAAMAEPDKYRSLTVRVAGYTAYFTELASDLQEEIIARTSYCSI